MYIASRFKSYFLRGLAVLLPTMLTIWIFIWGYKFIQDNISIYINRGLVRLIMFFQGEGGIDKETLNKIFVEGTGSVVGFVIALIGVCVVGMTLASVIGRTLWRMIEKFIMNTPFLRRVYPYIKQITDLLFAQDKKDQLFLRVVGVEYPRKGIWSIGMVTGEGLKKVSEIVEKKFLTVLIPTSPTPFTGFVIMVPEEETIELDITVEEALRFTVSAGVITPSVKLGDNETLALQESGSENKEKS